MISNENYNPVFLAGDVNNDFVIDMKDYKLVFDAIGSKDSKYDLNRDGSVDIADLSYVNSNIGKTKGQVEIVDLEKILELPKVKENSNLSSESFMERLNALKNK